MAVLERAPLPTLPTGLTHLPPRAVTRCNLWLTLHTRDAGAGIRPLLTYADPGIFLHLRASHLLIALPDEHPDLLDQESSVTLRLHLTDALGLGLVPSDFENGVGLCGGDLADRASRWRCRDAALFGLSDDGREWPLFGPDDFRRWLS